MNEKNYFIVSQSSYDRSTEKNLHVQIWNQKTYSLEKLEMKSRANKIIKSIQKKISENPVKNHQTPETRTLSSASKKTSNSLSTISQFSRSSKRISLAGKLEEIDKKLRENTELNLGRNLHKTQSFPESDALAGLLEDRNILSQSTLVKIREFDRKVLNLREMIIGFSKKKEEKVGIVYKPLGSFKKPRASEWGKSILVKRKHRMQNTII